MEKIKFDDWMGGHDTNNLDEFIGGNEIFDDNKTGKLFFELQKSYKGDNRFKLDERFKDDLNIDLMDKNLINRIDINKLQEYNNYDSQNHEDLDYNKELQHNLGILNTIIELKKKPIKKLAPYISKRFDPLNQTTHKLIKQKPKLPEPPKKDKTNIKKGINKKKLNIIKANDILKKALNPETPKKSTVININSNLLKQSKLDQEDFKLFN